jgi:Tfp pilus assembly protein PilF
MSLLMDALRKAEQAKQRTGQNDSPPTQPTTGAPIPPASAPPAPARSRLPDLSLHADAVDAELASVSSAAPARRQAPAAFSGAADEGQGEARERSAARNVFAAKEPPQSQSALWLVVGLGAIAALGLGAYFWWQLQAVSGGVAVRALPPLPAAQTSLPSAPLPVPVLPAAESVQSTPAVPPAAPHALARAAAASPPAGETAAAAEVRPGRVLKPAAAASPAAESPLRVARSQPKSNPMLERAYDGLQAGRLDEAQRDYELVVRSDAKNTDALLGLATVAMRRGQADAAQAFYLRALESDPNDATAQAGLITMRGQGDPGAAESRLKAALAGQPDSAVLYFALGNVYARQQRWSDAQQAYFRAYSSEPDNADIIFNLAVSLDHLHQNKLAAQYYQRALNVAGPGSPAFDKIQVKARLIDLQP